MASSHRQIIRSTAVIGLASLSTIAIGLVRTKAAALLVGPVGIGLIGLYLNLVTAASALAGLGLNASAVREIAGAEAEADAQRLDANRRALVFLSVAMALAAALAMVLLREPISTHVLQGQVPPGDVAWLAAAVALTVLSVACVILLNGFRRIAALAWVQVSGALLGTAAGLAALFYWREDGLLAYVLAAPAAALVVGLLFTARLPPLSTRSSPPPLVLRQSAIMARLGLLFMLSVLAQSLAVLAVRTFVHDELGAVALGQFAASWIISSIYVGSVLQAMGTDYYPRLSAVIGDEAAAAGQINEQVETALLLVTPVLLVALAIAPWLLQLAYSSAFVGAADLLRWQILGDIFKIAAWPLAMALLARDRGLHYVLIEAGAAGTLVAVTWLTIGRFGLVAPGIAYAVMYVLYLGAQLLAAGIAFTRRTVGVLVASIAVVAVTFLAALASEGLGLACGLVLAVIVALLAFRRLAEAGALPAAITGAASRFGLRRHS
jgi:O-antigen/teichoic acid export membrane protein